MSELDPAEVAARSLRVIPERFRKELEAPTVDRPPIAEREGLPPNYRMRADAHYVEQLIARSPDMAVRFIATDEIDDGGTIEPGSIEALAASIRSHGVLQPLLVRRDDNRYRVVAGRRRLAAATQAGLSSVPCIVHQVDLGKAEALALAENVRGRATPVAAIDAVPVEREALLDQLSVDIDGITSAAGLLAGQALPVSKRVTLDLVRSQAVRASWLLRAAEVLEHRGRGESQLCLLGPMLERVRDRLLPETRLSGVSLDLCIPDWNVSAVVDVRRMVTGLMGAFIATLGLVEQQPGATVNVMIVGSPDEPLALDVAQEAAGVPAGLAARFFEPGDTARPGGWPALIAALVARAVAREHGGDATFASRRGAGSTLRMTIGRGR